MITWFFSQTGVESRVGELMSKVTSTSEMMIDMFSSMFIRSVPLLEGIIVMDGVVNACMFGKEYLMYKLAETKVNKEDRGVLRREIVDKCKNIYRIGVIDRYIGYIVVYNIYCVQDTILRLIIELGGSGAKLQITSAFSSSSSIRRILYGMYCLIALPIVQDQILGIRRMSNMYTKYKKTKDVFFKYAISKGIIKYIKTLDE